MARITAMAVNTVWLALLLVAPSSGTNIWHISIDEAPAPPPELSPPFSRNAVRDPAMLKWQIVAIAASYVAAVLVLYTLLFTVGRRLRRGAQSSSGTLSMEMVRPNRWLHGSPQSNNGKFNSPKMLGGKRDSGKAASDIHPAHFDESVLHQDRIRREEDMERLYAAVMSTDTKSPKQVQIETQEIHEAPTNHPQRSLSGSSSSHASFKQRVYSQTSPDLPSNGFHSSNRGNVPASPSAPNFSSRSPYVTSQTPPPLPPPPREYVTPASPRSPPLRHARQLSGSSTHSGFSARSSRRSAAPSGRNLRISAPMPASLPSQADYDESTPLSPRYNAAHLPPPPPLPSQHPLHAQPPQSAGRMKSPRHTQHRRGQSTNVEDGDVTDIDSDIDEDDDDIISHYSNPITQSQRSLSQTQTYQQDIHPPRPPPSIAPQRNASYTSLPGSQQTLRRPGAVLSPSTSPPLLPPPPAGMRTSPAPTTGPKQLPFRAYTNTPPIANQGANQAIPGMNPLGMAPVSHPGLPTSPGPVKTTLLSPRRDHFNRGIGGGAQAMFSAGLATPYSPYMPFSPVTPVTPRLVRPAERRARTREEGRRIVTEEDAVRDESDLWGDAYS